MSIRFTDLINSGKKILFDGAFGTELYNRGVFINKCFEGINLSNPQIISEIHKNYVEAGAQVITTNTWGANRYKLKEYNLEDQIIPINESAVKLARSECKETNYLAGSIGPLGVRIEPWGPTSFQDAFEAFREQCQILADNEVDCFALETFSDITEIQQAIKACKAVSPETPIIAMLVITPEGKSPYGSPIEWAVSKLDEWQVDVVGLNCSVGPKSMMDVIAKIKSVTNKPICLQPNAGLPKEIDGRQIYMSTPEYLAHFTRDFLQAGVQIVGGCCGTTPSHIRSMANTLRQICAMEKESSEIQSQQNNSGKVSFELPKESPRIPEVEKSNWARKIANGEKVYSIELLPPNGTNADKVIEQSAFLKGKGIDAINIPDGPRASSRLSAMITAIMIEQKTGIETVLHYCCRDRNLVSMQSDMLGIHAIGLRNVLLITGDPPKLGNFPDATGVFDVDAIGLTNMVHKLNGGLDLGGNNIGTPTALSIGVGVNPVHRDFEYEMNRFKWKVKAGATWAITQPVFDLSTLYRFLEYIEKENIKIPIIAGIWPLTSYRNALFMNNEVPGVVIPPSIIEKMSNFESPEDSRKAGVEIANQMVNKIYKDVNGIQVSAPFGRIDLALGVMGI